MSPKTSTLPHVIQAARCAWGRFVADREGATAVEFALIALPFFGLMFVIIEIAMAFWVSQSLETAVSNASRQIYTGQFQTASTNQNLSATQLAANFKTLVCANVTALFDCNSTVYVDIRPVSSFSGASLTNPVNANGQFDPSSFGYQAAGSNAITVVRAAMEYPSFTSFFVDTSALTNGKRLIIATAVFKTEPYR